MVAPYEVVLQLYDTLNGIRIILLQKKQELGFDGSLIVVLFLILNHLDSDHLARLVVLALQNLSKCAFANQLNQLKPVADLVTADDAVVAFTVVEAVIYETLQFGWCIFLISLGEVKYFIVLGNLCHLVE